MPVDRYSRDLFCDGITDENGLLYLTEREPYGYVDLDDNVEHIVSAGDTLQTLAATFYADLPRPAMLWWIIADFQPDGGIFDPTIRIEPGTRLIIPSVRTVQEEIFNEKRRKVTQAA